MADTRAIAVSWNVALFVSQRRERAMGTAEGIITMVYHLIRQTAGSGSHSTYLGTYTQLAQHSAWI